MGKTVGGYSLKKLKIRELKRQQPYVPQETVQHITQVFYCREGCVTQDHQTYADCLRDANISIDKESLKVK